MMKTTADTAGGTAEIQTAELTDADLGHTNGGSDTLVTSYQLGVLDNDAALSSRGRRANAAVRPADQIRTDFTKIEYE